MNQVELQEKRKKIATVTKWGLGLVGAVLISPFVFLAVKGIIGLALAGLVGAASMAAAPVVGMKFANWKLRNIKEEAAKNPIETLENILLEKRSALGDFEGAITRFAAKVKNLEDKVEGLRKQYPDANEVREFESHLGKMNEVLQARKAKYKAAKKAILDFGEEIEKAKVVWDVSQAAQEVTREAGLDTGDGYEIIKAKTAIESVQNSMNMAIAELETDLMNEAAENGGQPLLEEKKVRLGVVEVVGDEHKEKARVRS